MASNPRQAGRTIHDMLLEHDVEPVFSLGDVIFYNTKTFFKKHNFGRDVKRFVNKNDWCVYNNKYHLNSRGMVTLGFAKKLDKVMQIVWELLNLPPSDLNLEPTQISPPDSKEEDDEEDEDDEVLEDDNKSSHAFKLTLPTRDAPVSLGSFESPRTPHTPDSQRNFAASNHFLRNGLNATPRSAHGRRHELEFKPDPSIPQQYPKRSLYQPSPTPAYKYAAPSHGMDPNTVPRYPAQTVYHPPHPYSQFSGGGTIVHGDMMNGLSLNDTDFVPDYSVERNSNFFMLLNNDLVGPPVDYGQLFPDLHGSGNTNDIMNFDS